jgi:hypothetical protein
MQRRTAENTSFFGAERVVFRKLKILIVERTQICVTSVVVYPFLLFTAMFSTISIPKVSFQQNKGGAAKLSFCNTPLCVLRAI